MEGVQLRQNVKVKEKLKIYIMDNDGNVIRTEEFKPPANKLEEIAAKLGILKRANSVNSMGFHVAAKRFVGLSIGAVKWIGAQNSAGSWSFLSAEATVYSAIAILSNPINKWEWTGALTGHYKQIGAATSNNASQIVSTISGINLMVHDGAFWVEIEYEFS